LPRPLWSAAVVLILLPCLQFPAQAAPAGPDLVRADLALVLETPGRGRLDGALAFHRYSLNGTPVPADSLRLALSGPDGPSVRAGLESAARSLFRDHFTTIFPQDTLSSISCLLDNSSLEDVPGTGENDPAVVVRATGVVALRPGSFGLPETADLDALAPLVLGDGAELHRDLTINASPGHYIELTLGSFPGSVFGETGNRTLLQSLDNTEGMAPASRSFDATLRTANPRPAGADSLSVLGTIDIPDLSTVRITGSVEFGRADPTGYWTPPAGVRNLTRVSGATLSELVRSGVLPEEDIYEYGVLPVQAALQARLAAILNVSLAFVPAWSTDGNLTCTVRAESANRSLFGLSSTLILGALNAGACYSFSIPVDIGWPVELGFVMPAGMRLEGLAPAGTQSGRLRFTWASPTGRGTIGACISSTRVAAHAGDDVAVTVLADFSDPKIDPGQLVSSGTTVVPVSVEARLRIGVVAVPSSIAQYLPANLTLTYMTADLLRLLLAEGLVTDRELDAVLQQMRPRLDSAMRAALGQSVRPEIRFVPETLEGCDLDRMDGSRPLEIWARASGERTRQLDLFKSVRASPGLTSITQDFAFKSVSGWNISYRVRFSPDTRLVSIHHKGVKPVRGTEGGRDFFEVAFGREGGSSNVTVALEPSPGLLLRSLGPVCVPTLILLAVAIVLAARGVRRRRRRRAAARLVEWDPPGK